MQIIDIAAMRRLEQVAIAGGTPGFQLMERAGRAAAELIDRFAAGKGFRRAVFLVGSGNNGGDALVAARFVSLPAVIYTVRPLSEMRHEAAEAVTTLPRHIPVSVKQTLHAEDWQPGDLLVDGLLGIGFSGALRRPYLNYIREINASGRPVVALDLPSGIDADTGEAVSGVAVQSSLTITFGLPKQGLFQADGPSHAGPIYVADIGLGQNDLPTAGPAAFSERDAVALLRTPAQDDYKNRRGRLLLVAGSQEFAGAAVLNACGALRAGAGLTHLAVPCRPYAALPGAVIVSETPGAAGCFGISSLPMLRPALGKADALVAGSGWGEGAELSAVLDALLEFPGPLLLDADALNLLARQPTLWRRREGLVITPHPGEAARLAAAFEVPLTQNRVEFALAIAQRLHAVILLKGPQTVIAAPDGRCYINTSGNHLLATGGSGDVLTGVIGALLASQPKRTFEMAALGAFLHGRAGESGDYGLIADDLPCLIGAVIARLRHTGA